MSDNSDSYNSPPNEEVLLEDEQPMTSIPVTVENRVRTDEMPCEIGALKNIRLPTGSTSVKILEENPRRKRAVMWISLMGASPANNLIGAMLGRSYSEISSGFTGPMLFVINAVIRYDFCPRTELWAKGANIVFNSGNLVSVGTSTNDILVHVFEEEWAR